MLNIDLIADLVTEDPDIVNEGKTREVLKFAFDKIFNKIKGKEDSFVKKLHRQIGTQGLIDIIDSVKNGVNQNNESAVKALIKELFMWIGVPLSTASIAMLAGLPVILTLIFKSVAWFSVVNIRLELKRRSKLKTNDIPIDA